MNPTDLKRGVDRAVEAVVEDLNDEKTSHRSTVSSVHRWK
jgi:chaperonin GroEL (HSP60 family)